MKLLKGEELNRAVEASAGWAVEDNALVKTFGFADFVSAMRFVNAAACVAEELGHHPDIDIRYNRVRMGLTTHDAGGITQRDIELAKRLSSL